MSYKIGIDFGTTNTVISYLKDGSPEEFKYPANDASYFIPSLISTDKNWIGSTAWAGDYVKAVKMYLPLNEAERKESGWNDAQGTPEEFVKVFFERLLKKEHSDSFETRIGEISEIVLCVPHVWSKEISHKGREVMKKIFADLGYKVGRIVSEPVAAAAFFVNWCKDKEKKSFTGNLLVCDMGGGTFDVTLCEVKDSGKIEGIRNEGNGTTQTGIGYAGVYFDEQLIRGSQNNEENIDPETYKNLQREKLDTSPRLPQRFELIEKSPEGDRAAMPIYKVSGHVFTYSDVISAFAKVSEEIKKVLSKIYSKDIKIDAYFLTGGFNQFYLCQKEIINFFNVQNFTGKVYGASADTSIAGKSISFGAALIANGLVEIDEKFPHSFGFISYRHVKNKSGAILRAEQVYTALITGGNKLETYSKYCYAKQTFNTMGTRRFHFEFYVDFNANSSERHLFALKDFTLPNPNKPENKWNVGFRLDSSQIVWVAFKDKDGEIAEYQLLDVLQYEGKLISN